MKIVQKGFTLVELLIVIAVLGVLASVLLVAIDPAEQFARGRDAGKKSSIAQLGHALQSYYTSHSGAYPTADDTWATSLVNAGEIKNAPKNPDASGCAAATAEEEGFCYKVSGAAPYDIVVYTKMTSKSEDSKCTPATKGTWYVYSSLDGRAGVVCTADETTEPAVGAQTFVST